ncbi:PREDICTED: WD repeat-containing protein 63 [Cyprinodon variegatus]|uniref:WD repeat-containing protein 63 n=1 Tax=Cyprinodon variegatus TaxID=28743 RepID=UPI0007427EAD|nr:PREDICTED: WD repeat-containing protein 63 [Cyprinodon variegatus]
MPPKGRKKSTNTAGSKRKVRSSLSSTRHENTIQPDGIFPLVLTSATQELFDCCADKDVTKKSPHKLLKKDDILQDIKTRAAESDFTPVKEIVLDYPEEEILLVFDADFTHGQNFYLVLAPEAKDILKPLDTTSDVFEAEVKKTPPPKQWISLGSEKEIEGPLKESRGKLRLKISLERELGLPVCFTDFTRADSELGCTSYQDSRFNIKILTRDCGIQAVPEEQTNSSQTTRNTQNNMDAQYNPREFSNEEKEKILQDESLKNILATQTPRTLHALQEEEIMNVFINYFKDLLPESAITWSEPVLVFSDNKFCGNKEISCLNWHPMIYGVIAIALIQKREKQSERTALLELEPALIIFWSFFDPYHPQLLLECPDEILAFEFCPSNPNIIAGGCVNGKVVLWDISAHVNYLQAAQPGTFDLNDNKVNRTPVVPYCVESENKSSHRAPITDLQWLPPTFQVNKMGLPLENKMKVSVQFVTCSPDRTLRFWDVRCKDLEPPETTYSIPGMFQHLTSSWKPFFTVSLPETETDGKYAPLNFCYEHQTCTTEKSTEKKWPDVLPDYSQLRIPSSTNLKPMEDVNTKVFLGTEKGEIVYTDWKMETKGSSRPNSAAPLLHFNTHHPFVNTMQRSPFFKDIILTTGGLNFAIWKEGVMKGPLVVSKKYEQECTAGCWSLSQPAVFFIGKEDGSVEEWDLLKKNSKPAQLIPHISKGKITCMKPWAVSAKKNFLAIADDLGIVAVFDMSKSQVETQSHEIESMKKYIDRHTEYVESDEVLTKKTKEVEELKKKMEPDKPAMLLTDNIDPHKEHNDFVQREERILRSLSSWPTAEEP